MKKQNILIVDDESINLSMIVEVLSEKYNLFGAKDGVTALEIANSDENIDLILLDIIMPEMDGFEVIKKLKSQESTKGIPIIFLTAKIDNEDIVKGLNMGAVDYIAKPFNKDILLARVQTHLTLRYQSILLEEEKSLLEKRVQEELNKRLQTSAKLNALYEQTNLGISFINQKGEFIDVNRKFGQLLDYSKNEMLKLNIHTLTHPDNLKESKKVFEEIVKGNLKYLEIEKKFLKKDGSYTCFHVGLTRVEDPLNEDNFYIASVCKDITKEVLLREELKGKEEMLIVQSRQAAMGNMIGMIAHQWRQPLNIIGLIASNIQLEVEVEDPIDNNILIRNADEINEQVKYLSETIEDFKNYFKPNKKKESTTVNDIIEKTLHLISHSFTNTNIEIQKDLNLTTEIEIFPNELMQVFINIINNAKDAIVSNKIQNPKIMINVSEDDKNIIIIVADNAGGISPEVIDNLGNLYFTTKDSGGTGLGMHMSKTIIEKHLHGILKWENRDEGACFIVTLPKE